jgi:hypothetical protein
MKFNYYVWTQRSSHHPFLRVSWRFESIYILQGINLTTRHTWVQIHHEWQQFMTTTKESSQAHLTLVHVFHTISCSGLSMGGTCTIPYTPKRYDRVSSNLATDEATKFAGLHKSYMRQYRIKCLFIRAQLAWPLIDTGGGYHLGASNLWFSPLILLNCPAWSHIKPFYQLFKFLTFHSLTRV